MYVLALTTNSKVWKLMLLIVVVLTLLFSTVFYFKNIFITFIIGFALILFTRIFLKKAEKLLKRFPKNIFTKVLSVLILIAFWLALLYYLISFTAADLTELTSTIKESNQDIVSIVNTKLGSFIPNSLEDKPMVKEIVGSYLSGFKDYFAGFLAETVSTIASILLSAILIIPLLFYIYFGRREELWNKVVKLVPKKFRSTFKTVYKDASDELYLFFSAKLIESAIIAIVCAVGFYLAGLKGWLFLALLAGFLNIIPYLGPILGAIPPLFLSLLHPSMSTTYYVLTTIIIAQLLDNLYIIPFMISSKVKIDPLLSLVLILVGAKLLGPLGMILAIPIYSVYKIALIETYDRLVKMYDPRSRKA